MTLLYVYLVGAVVAWVMWCVPLRIYGKNNDVMLAVIIVVLSVLWPLTIPLWLTMAFIGVKPK